MARVTAVDPSGKARVFVHAEESQRKRLPPHLCTGVLFTNYCYGSWGGCNKGGSDRLSAASATFVDVMHCNRGLMGLDEDAGHVDFWMGEDGVTQPQ